MLECMGRARFRHWRQFLSVVSFFAISMAGVAQEPAIVLAPEGQNARQFGNLLHYAFSKTGSCRVVPSGGAKVVVRSKGDSMLEGTLTSTSGKKLFRRTYNRGSDGLNAYQLADDVTFVLSKKPGIATSQFVFVLDQGNRKLLKVCDFDGKNVRMLESGYQMAQSPAVSPNGRQVALLAVNNGVGRLQIKDLATGRNLSPLKQEAVAGHFSWSPDGKTIAAVLAPRSNPRAGQLFTLSPTRIQSSSPLAVPPTVPSALSWSSDGKRLVFAAETATDRSGLFLIDIKSGTKSKPKPLPLPMHHASSPNWSPDGEKIAFVAKEGPSRFVCTYSFRANHVRKIAPGFDPCWGADSRHLIYSSGPELRSVDTRSGKVSVLVGGMGRIIQPSWTR